MIRDVHHGLPCPYCRRSMDRQDARLMATRDHVIPRIHGGRQIVICCFTCNNTKADMLPDVWRAYMAANPGWWLLSRMERRTIRRRALRVYDHADAKGNRILRRQGTPPMPPVVVPPELIWT